MNTSKVKAPPAVKRFNKKPGDIFRFPLSHSDYQGYCQWLHDGSVVFFLVSSPEPLTTQELLTRPFAFRVQVFKDTPGKYGWEKIGNAPINEEFLGVPKYSMKDRISGELSIYENDVIRPPTTEELKIMSTFEVAAVWAHPHIVERLEAQINGGKSLFLESIKIATAER